MAASGSPGDNLSFVEVKSIVSSVELVRLRFAPLPVCVNARGPNRLRNERIEQLSSCIPLCKSYRGAVIRHAHAQRDAQTSQSIDYLRTRLSFNFSRKAHPTLYCLIAPRRKKQIAKKPHTQ